MKGLQAKKRSAPPWK